MPDITVPTMTMPKGFVVKEIKAAERVWQIPMNQWQPSHQEQTINNYHCPICAYSHSQKRKIIDHLAVGTHMYGFQHGVNPFTGLPFAPFIEWQPAEAILAKLFGDDVEDDDEEDN
jgi:hypothetical protein